MIVLKIITISKTVIFFKTNRKIFKLHIRQYISILNFRTEEKKKIYKGFSYSKFDNHQYEKVELCTKNPMKR